MRKASKVLLTVGGILHIVNGVTFLMGGLVFIIFSLIFLTTGNLYGSELVGDMGELDYELAMNIVAGLYVAFAQTFIALGILSLIGSKLTFRTRESNEKRKLITTIVFGGILDNYPAVLGGIFGLIANGKEEQKVNEKPDETPVASEAVD